MITYKMRVTYINIDFSEAMDVHEVTYIFVRANSKFKKFADVIKQMTLDITLGYISFMR